MRMEYAPPGRGLSESAAAQPSRPNSPAVRVYLLTFLNLNTGCILQAASLRLALLLLGQGNWSVDVIPFRSKTATSFMAPYERPSVRTLQFESLLGIRLSKLTHLAPVALLKARQARNVTMERGMQEVLVIGSDEVWNIHSPMGGPAPRMFPKVYFGEGFQAAWSKRIIYAASMGRLDSNTGKRGDRKDSLQRYYRAKGYASAISSLDRISVREREAVDFVANVSNRNVEEVAVSVDPTWLWYPCWLDPRALGRFMSTLLSPAAFTEGMAGVPGVRAFIRMCDTQASRDASALELQALTRELMIYCTDWKELKGVLQFARQSQLNVRPTVSLQVGLDIFDWVGLIRSAVKVATTTFHGTLFAILTGRQFVVCSNKNSTKAPSTKVGDLLESLGLSDRVVASCHEKGAFSWPEDPINYTTIRPQLIARRDLSWAWLRRSVEHLVPNSAGNASVGGRQTDRQIDRQTDRQTDKETRCRSRGRPRGRLVDGQQLTTLSHIRGCSEQPLIT